MTADDLNTEVEAFKTRSAEHEAFAAERAASRSERGISATMENVTLISDLMPEVLASLERTRASIAAFNEEIRPQWNDLREKPCKAHPLVMRQPAFEETCQASRANRGVFTPAYSPCGSCADERTRAAYRDFWTRRGVEQRNIDATLDNFFPVGDAVKSEALSRVCAWQARSGLFLLLYGSPGTGKGHLATGCLKAAGGGRFVKQADMLRELRDSYTTNTTTDCIARWQESPMLAIDEFGVSGGGKDESPMLYQVLADRYDKRRPTVITTNLCVTELRAALGVALLDRVKEDCEQIAMNWKSYRSPKP